MFGTISQAQLKPGQETQLQGLLDEWKRTIRPTVPGSFLELVGHAAGHPDQLIFVALARDEATYRAMAASPQQGEFYGRFNAVFTGEPTWQEVEIDVTIRD